MNAMDMITAVLTIVGALEMSYVESVILTQYGHAPGRNRLLRQIYWNDLSWMNRSLFWSGAVLLLSPFMISLFVRLTH